MNETYSLCYDFHMSILWLLAGTCKLKLLPDTEGKLGVFVRFLRLRYGHSSFFEDYIHGISELCPISPFGRGGAAHDFQALASDTSVSCRRVSNGVA